MLEMSARNQIPISIGALARRLGVLPATIRDWELRYGIGASERSSGGHRRYAKSDVDRLVAMRALVLDGIAPSDAARAILDVGWNAASYGEPKNPRGPGTGAGGRSLALSVQTRESRSFARAVLALDGASVRSMLDRCIEEHGVLATWEGLAVPVLRSLGELVASGGAGIASEHLLSSQLIASLDGVAARVTQPRNHRTLLLVSAPDDLHDLPLHAVAALLGEQNVASTLLGARTPLAVLQDAVKRLNPSLVLVWASTPVAAQTSRDLVIPSQRPPVRCFVGGPGWVQVPRGASKVDSLEGCVAECLKAAGLS